MKKYLFPLFCMLLLSNTLFAAYLTDYPIKIKQPNGETVQLYVTGDEYYHRVHNADGYTIIRDPQTGYLVYAVLENNELVSSGYFVGKVDPQTVGLKPEIDISAEKKIQIRQDILKAMQTPSDLQTSSASFRADNVGTLNNLVIYIRFADDPEFNRARSIVENYFNKDEDGESVYRYFYDLSYEKLTIKSTFYPKTTGQTILSYQDTQPRGYFEPQSGSNPGGYSSLVERGIREVTLIKRAVTDINGRNEIPSDLNLDFDNDSYVDNICFIIKGEPGPWSEILWPHKSWYVDTNPLDFLFNPLSINGKKVGNYIFHIEEFIFSGNRRLSVLTHELFHSLGAPDYYRYDDNTINPVGSWDLMGSDTDPSQSATAWTKYKYGKWNAEPVEITRSGVYTINNIWSETNNCYKIASPNSTTEFFMIEYRNKNVKWDSNLPGSGLIIYRVSPNTNGNTNGPPDELYVFRQGGRNTTTNGNINYAYFSSSGRTTFSDSSDPPAFLSDNTPGLGGIVISEIGPAGGETMSFKVSFPESEPIVDFTVETVSDFTRKFINESVASPETEWLWDFGDGTHSTEKEPEHTYGIAGIYNVTLTAENNAGKSSKTIRIPVSGAEWEGGKDSSWNEPLNWLAGHVPVPTDIVTISSAALHFPILTSNVTVAEIRFEPGTQIGNQSKLAAGKAFVQYDLNKTERWQMLSIPLGQVYPADFAFGGYPLTWMRTFSSARVGNSTTGRWDNIRDSRDAFSFGKGFVLWVNEFDSFDEKGLGRLEGIREFPFFHHHAEDSPDRDRYEKINLAHDYSSTTGKSTFFNFSNTSGEYKRTNESYDVSRTNEAYQLAGANFTAITPNFEDGIFALIGNPYMAVLKFEDFYETNNDLIRQNYYIWTGIGYTIFTPEGTTGAYIEDDSEDQLIAPLQGFIVEKVEAEAETRSAYFPQLSINENMTTVDKSVVLRSSVSAGNKLDIVARNPVAGIRTFIAKREGGQDEFGNLDARKIINGITDVPEIYTLKPYKGGLIAVGANIINNDELRIPVGLATSYTGNITLSFSGMDTYDAKLYLIDTETNREIELTGLTSYDYVVNYTPSKVNGETAVCEDRFFIRISKTVTGLTGTIAEKTNVYEANGLVKVVSGASNPIKEVAVYNLQGALMYKESAINAISHTVNRNWPAGAYIVKVVSEKNIDNVKLIIR